MDGYIRSTKVFSLSRCHEELKIVLIYQEATDAHRYILDVVKSVQRFVRVY